MRGTLIVVIHHVIETGKFSFRHDGVALGPWIIHGNAGVEGQDIGLAVLVTMVITLARTLPCELESDGQGSPTLCCFRASALYWAMRPCCISISAILNMVTRTILVVMVKSVVCVVTRRDSARRSSGFRVARPWGKKKEFKKQIIKVLRKSSLHNESLSPAKS